MVGSFGVSVAVSHGPGLVHHGDFVRGCCWIRKVGFGPSIPTPTSAKMLRSGVKQRLVGEATRYKVNRSGSAP